MSGADDDVTTVYEAGDPDPTQRSHEKGRMPCRAPHFDGYGCTWPEGHAHPQHIAGTTNLGIAAVWPVATLPLADTDHVVALIGLQADMHWHDTRPDETATPMARLLAYLDHEARTCGVCRGAGRVAAPGTAGLPGGHPDTDDVTCPACDGA